MAIGKPAQQAPAGEPTGRRQPLNRQRVLSAALAYADRHGLAGLTMRRLGTELGVEGMSLYKHVADKDALLDGIVELLWAEVPAGPAPDAGWRQALRNFADGLYRVFGRHPIVAPLIATRNFVNIEVLRRYQAYLELLRQTGFDRRRGLDAIGAVVGQGVGYGLLALRYTDPAPQTAEPESNLQRIRRITRTLPADVPDPLVELAVDLTSECDTDRCFAISIDALLAGLAPGPA
ncbi:MAG: TetR family transcriptional regulator [Micromonosporaceae bacterium]|nr:TetR family transcriptional regulator [Micromonosporaceae bacterium]